MNYNLQLKDSSLFSDISDTAAEQISGGLNLSFKIEIEGSPKELKKLFKTIKKFKKK